MNYRKVFSLLLIVLMGLAPSLNIRISPMSIKVNGEIGEEVPNPAVKVGNLQDKAYTYTGADIVVHDYNLHIDGHVTVVVIDDGLHWKEWKALEQNPEANVVIIGFVTEDTDDSIKWINDPDDLFLKSQKVFGHGFAVVSALAAIARDVEVIFVDMQMYKPPFLYDPYGFELNDESLWNFIDTYQASFDIDIVSCSLATSSDYATSAILDKWDSLNSKGVMMINCAGNGGNYWNYEYGDYQKYSQYYTKWYAVGSIDHENRQGESIKNQKSSFSSWYESNTSGNHIVNWLAPGNGVPVLEQPYYDPSLSVYRGTWVYQVGTSVSTPYLAGIIALIITCYHRGIGSYTDPSVQKVIDILQYASSRSTFDQKMGYGYVDAYLATGKAYTEGRLAA